MNVRSPHKRWSTLESAVFGSITSLILLISEGGRLVCESVDKADLSDHMTASSAGRLLIYHSLVIPLPILPPFG